MISVISTVSEQIQYDRPKLTARDMRNKILKYNNILVDKVFSVRYLFSVKSLSLSKMTTDTRCTILYTQTARTFMSHFERR